MIAKFHDIWAAAAQRRTLSLDVEARLTATLFRHVGSLVAGHVGGLVLAALAINEIGRPWPFVLTAALCVTAALRAFVFYKARHLPDPAAPHDVLRLRRPYVAVSVAWCIISAALCSFCILAGNGSLQLIAVFLILGTTGGIASRNACSPRLALIQIVIWLLPSLPEATKVDESFWTIVLLVGIYFAALASIVRRHYNDIVALIDAEQTSQLAQLKLQEREAEVLGLFENAAAGVNEFDIAIGRFIRVNRIFCEMIGYTAAEMLGGMKPASFTHPEDRAQQAEQWAAIQTTGESFECERRYIRSDGSEVWGRVGASVAARTADGRPSRIITVIQDITELKLAGAALRASQDLLHLSLDIGGVGTFRRDYQAGLIYCGPETRQMHGLPPGDGPIGADVWLRTVPVDDQPRLLREFSDVYAGRRSIAAFDYRFEHPERGLRHAMTRSRLEYDDRGRPLSSVGVVIDVTEQRSAERRLAHLAHHDPLTDLPNRTLFGINLEKGLSRAKEGVRCAILCLDLDHFKEVNDTFGHPVGDALLRTVSARLMTFLRPSDSVARLGGDEFAIILSPLEHDADMAAFAAAVVVALSAPYDVDGHRLVVGTSIGIAVAPDDGLDAGRLLRNADVALYAAKREGRGRYHFFDPAMDKMIQARRALEADLRKALANEAFELFYQPLVSAATRRIRGFEALIRWRHVTRGFVLPNAFIPLAEATGLIVPMGAFVLHRACAEAAAWPGSPSIAVNLSASEFNSPDIVGTVASALHQSGLDPCRLELEITESTMLQDTEATTATLLRLKTLGVRIAIDDFGTGFSSLSYLQRFPFDKVKIDRSFVAPLGRTRESSVIVKAIVGLCAGLDMKSTAEGVETEEQLAILSGIGCIEIQGFYFSPPRPAGDVAALIERLGIEPREAEPVAEPLTIDRSPMDGVNPRKFNWYGPLTLPAA